MELSESLPHEILHRDLPPVTRMTEESRPNDNGVFL
jgi:hypothetical protein